MQISMNNVALYQNKNEQLYKPGSARGDAWLRRISSNNLLPLENASSLLKTLLPQFPKVSGLTLKSLVLIYPSVRPSVHPVMREFKLRDAHQPDVDVCILEP